jgi:hypothetical protein
MKVLIGLAVAFKVAQLGAAIAAFAVSAGTNPAKAIAGIAIATIAAGAITGLVSKVGDAVFPASGKGMISPKEGGLFQVSDNDDIVVGPKLAQAITGEAPRPAQAVGGGGTSQNIQNKVDISPSNTNITLNLNGQAIGNANARQNYGVGKNIRALGGNVDYSASV